MIVYLIVVLLVFNLLIDLIYLFMFDSVFKLIKLLIERDVDVGSKGRNKSKDS